MICVPLLLLARKLKVDEESSNGPSTKMSRLVCKIILSVVLLAVIVWNIYLSTYVNWHRFDSKGYLDVFRKALGLRWLMFGISFLISFVFVFVNMKFAFVKLRGKSSDTEVALLASFIVALMFGAAMAGQWNVWLLNKYQVLSDVTDPIFGRSISYYLFTLPWKINLRSMIRGLFIFTFFILMGWFVFRVLLRIARKKQSKNVEEKSYTITTTVKAGFSLTLIGRSSVSPGDSILIR